MPIDAQASSSQSAARGFGTGTVTNRPEALFAEYPPQRSAKSASGLQFTRTVPRHVVHRAAMAEVFLTDAVRISEDRFLLAAQWPRDHALFCADAAGTADPLLVAESIRQSLLYVAHTYQNVPLPHHFVGYDFAIEITDPEPLLVGSTPLAAVLDAHWTLPSRQPNRMRLQAEVSVGGRRCGHGSLHVLAVDDRRYALLRKRGGRPERQAPDYEGPAASPFRPVAPAAVGRLREKDVILERDEEHGRHRLRIDPGHPIFFDHPSDHLPVMVALEGFRQFGHVLAHEPAGAGPMSLRSARLDCLAFGELDEPVDLVVRSSGPGPLPHSFRLRVDAVQGGRELVQGDLLWAPAIAGPKGE